MYNVIVPLQVHETPFGKTIAHFLAKLLTHIWLVDQKCMSSTAYYITHAMDTPPRDFGTWWTHSYLVYCDLFVSTAIVFADL